MTLKRALVRMGKPKFRETSAVMPQPRRVLDIGIANDSYAECKAVFPNAVYDGLDFEDRRVAMLPGDKFFLVNLEHPSSLAELAPDYDLIIANHVLEHLIGGHEVFASLLRLLAPGGVLYAEFPSLRTAARRKKGKSYHFHDDPTHRRVYRLEDLANLTFDAKCRVLSCGPISTPLKDSLAVPRAVVGWLRGQGAQPYLVHTLRKIDHIMVQRGSAPSGG
jgi:trans-aconitate methyltransferase